MIPIEKLEALIAGLEEYKRKGVVDPWILDDGSTVDPLEALKELKAGRAFREAFEKLPKEFWEDGDHAVGGYISKKELYDLFTAFDKAVSE